MTKTEKEILKLKEYLNESGFFPEEKEIKKMVISFNLLNGLRESNMIFECNEYFEINYHDYFLKQIAKNEKTEAHRYDLTNSYFKKYGLTIHVPHIYYSVVKKDNFGRILKTIL